MNKVETAIAKEFLREFREFNDKWSNFRICLDYEFCTNGFMVVTVLENGQRQVADMDQDLVDRHFSRCCQVRPAPGYKVCAAPTEDGEKFCEQHRTPCVDCGGEEGEQAAGCPICFALTCSRCHNKHIRSHENEQCHQPKNNMNG